MVLKKSSLVGHNEFLVTCPKCPRTYKITPSEVENSDRLLKIYGMKGLYIYQCQCGARVNVQLDFRRKQRHAREIGCFYTFLTRKNTVQKPGMANQPYGTRINSVIKNISADGIGFITNDHHNVEPGDELLVKFILTKSGGSGINMIERRVTVRTVSGHEIGAEFFANDKKDPAIGFYLMGE